jgi:hypothetical protein
LVFRRRKSEPSPPGQDEIVDRVLCIAVTAMLGAVLANLRDGALDESRAAQYATEAHRWLRRENLADSLSARERALVAKPLEEWTEQESIEVGWGDESAGVLLWAISAVDDLPPYDTRFESLPSLVPLLAPTADFRQAARLRPAEEIRRARDLAELWHWRSRTTKLQLAGDPQGEGIDLDVVARQSATLAHAEGSIPAPVDGDFPAFGKAYRDLDEDEYSNATSIAMERHRAFNWLCGCALDWDSVPTESSARRSSRA